VARGKAATACDGGGCDDMMMGCITQDKGTRATSKRSQGQDSGQATGSRCRIPDNTNSRRSEKNNGDCRSGGLELEACRHAKD
jgi:hypothetical protein